MKLMAILLTLAILCAIGYVRTDTANKDNPQINVKESDAMPFKATKIVQIGIVVRDVEKYAKSYAEFFGVPVPEVIISETEDKARTQYHGQPTKARVKQAFFHFDNIVIELLEPVGAPSTWQEFLDRNGEGVHHIACEIKDMDAHTASMRERGVDVVQQGRWTTYTGGRYAYFDSNAQLAVMLELLENF